MEKVLNVPIQAMEAEKLMNAFLIPTHQTVIAGNIVKGSYEYLVGLINCTGKIGYPITKIK